MRVLTEEDICQFSWRGPSYEVSWLWSWNAEEFMHHHVTVSACRCKLDARLKLQAKISVCGHFCDAERPVGRPGGPTDQLVLLHGIFPPIQAAYDTMRGMVVVVQGHRSKYVCDLAGWNRGPIVPVLHRRFLGLDVPVPIPLEVLHCWGQVRDRVMFSAAANCLHNVMFQSTIINMLSNC